MSVYRQAPRHLTSVHGKSHLVIKGPTTVRAIVERGPGIFGQDHLRKRWRLPDVSFQVLRAFLRYCDNGTKVFFVWPTL